MPLEPRIVDNGRALLCRNPILIKVTEQRRIMFQHIGPEYSGISSKTGGRFRRSSMIGHVDGEIEIDECNSLLTPQRSYVGISLHRLPPGRPNLAARPAWAESGMVPRSA